MTNVVVGVFFAQKHMGPTEETVRKIFRDILTALQTGVPVTGSLEVDTTGLATEAKQDTIIGHVDGIEGLLTTIDADTSILAATDFATEAKQDAIITAIWSIPGGGGQQYDIQDTLGATDTGTIALVVRNDTLADLSGADGDLAPLQVDAKGALYSRLKGIEADNGGGDFNVIYGFSPTDTDNNDPGIVVNSHGMVWNGSAWARLKGDATSGLFAQIKGDALTALQNMDTDLTTIIGHVDGIEGAVDGIEALIGTTNSTLTTIDGRVDGLETLVTSTNTKLDTVIGHVDGIEGFVDGIEGILTTMDADTGGILTAVQIMDDWDNGASDGASVSGDVAHDTADAGEPVKIGGKALNLGANPTGVTTNDRVNGMFTRAGQMVTIGGHVNVVTKNLNVTDADGAQTNADVLGAIGSNVSVVVTKISVMADGANTGDVAVRLGFGTASVPAADSAGIVFAHPGIKPGSGVVEGNGGGILGIGASGEELRVTCEDPAGGAIDITVSYFTIEI